MKCGGGIGKSNHLDIANRHLLTFSDQNAYTEEDQRLGEIHLINEDNCECK